MKTTRAQINIIDSFFKQGVPIPIDISRYLKIKQFYERLELKLFLIDIEEKLHS